MIEINENYPGDLNDDNISLKVRINTEIFPDFDKNSTIDASRMSFVSENTLIKYKIFNKTWKVINFGENKTMTYISCVDNLKIEIENENDDDTIYIHPALAHILNVNPDDDNGEIPSISRVNRVNISDLYEEIQTSQIKHKYSEDNPILRNLPLAKKIKIKILHNVNNHVNKDKVKDKIISYFNNTKHDRVISLNEVIAIKNTDSDHDNFVIDMFYGIVTNKNNIVYIEIIEIEYEEYDFLRNYLNLNKRNVLNIVNTGKDKSCKSVINAYAILAVNNNGNSGNNDNNDKENLADFAFANDKNVKIEIVSNDFTSPTNLPKQILKFLNNSEKSKNYQNSKNSQNLKTKFTELMKKPKFSLQMNNLNSLITNSNTIFLIGPIHCGINYTLRNICDNIGARFIKKDLKKFKSAVKFLNYLKKLEFMTPCLVNFKNGKKLHQLLETSGNVFTELKAIMKREYIKHEDNGQSLNSNNSAVITKIKIIFTFSFENSTEIENYLKILADGTFEYTLPDIEARIDLIKTGLNNVFYNIEAVMGVKFGKKMVKILKSNCNNNEEEDFKAELEGLNYFEIAKMTVGYDMKEIKNMIKAIFYNFYEEYTINSEKSEKSGKNRINLQNLIKKTFSILKSSRLKNEKTISSIPEIKWEDVGGLEHAKEDINDTIQLPIKYPKLFENSLKRRSGLLLYGPPGSGKTLLAKAIANECSMNFISVKGPELLNMYVGESEKNIREVFERGRSNRPCCLFFDEIDALAPARTKNSDQNNVMDRIVAQFMTEMDGLTKENDLIIIASTNRPDLVDPSLLRPGRFDKMIYVGLPKSVMETMKIYRAQTLKLKLGDDVDFEKMANNSPEDYSGADIYAVCALAFTTALKEKLAEDNKEGHGNDNTNIVVNDAHFMKAIKRISPSLQKSEIKKYEDLRDKYSINM